MELYVFITKLLPIIRENLISYLICSFFGVIVTTLVFYLTSPPSSPEKIRKKFKHMILKKLQKELFSGKKVEPKIDTFFTQELDLNSVKIIVTFGTWEPKKNFEWHRWIGIFESQAPKLLDKLVGRSGFYKLTSFTHIKIPNPNALIVSKFEAKDLDGDGIPEIYVTLKSTWADSTSIGPLILRKYKSTSWQVLGLPSISFLTHEILRGKLPDQKRRISSARPFGFFDKPENVNSLNRPPLDKLLDAKIYEDSWTLIHNGMKVNFVTLRNGGTYEIRTHPIKDYPQIATIAFFNDGRAVLDAHYSVVTFFRIEDEGLCRDLLWNWGYPMISAIPMRPKEIDIESIAKAGIEAHKIGDIFFGYTEFIRI